MTLLIAYLIVIPSRPHPAHHNRQDPYTKLSDDQKVRERQIHQHMIALSQCNDDLETEE